jgi:hypothetical protein
MTIQQDRTAEDGVTKLLDLEASSKIQILSAPIQLPGVCGLCGTSRNDDRQYVDIGIWIEFYGQFYFCTFCFTEFANRLGCLMPEQVKVLEDELDAARQRILEFETKDQTLNDAISTLRDTGLFSGTDLSAVRRSGTPTDEQESSRTNSNEQLSFGNFEDTEQSDSEQGSDDVSTTRDDESKFDFTI